MIGRLPARSLLAIWMPVCLLGNVLDAAAEQQPPARIANVRIGFNGCYKLGCWTPVVVTIEGGAESGTGRIELVLADGDGVPTRVSTPAVPNVVVTPGQRTTTLLYAKLGRADGTLTIRLVVGQHLRAERIYRPATEADDRHIPQAMPSTDALILTVGPAAGVAHAVARTDADQRVTTKVVSLPDSSCLPTRWYGYDGVDTLVIATSQPEPLRPLRDDRKRVDALAQWLRHGGQLVLLASANAAAILSPPSPLAELAPGRFKRLVPLPDWRSLETYCDCSAPIPAVRGAARPQVPLLGDVTGRIEAYAGNRPHDLPLVVRAPVGFGHVVLAAVDPNQPPLKHWPGRDALLRKILGRTPRKQASDHHEPRGRVTTLGYHDLTGQLRDALDQFAGIRTVPFSVVVSLVLVYVLLIGPADFFLVKIWLKRTALTWITFPIWIVLFSAGGYGLAGWLKGDQLHLNRAELVDMDVETGLVRGTTWMHVFSPRAETYNLSFRPRPPVTLAGTGRRTLLSWMGLPGTALGGMRAPQTAIAFAGRPYAFATQLNQLEGVPIGTWSTKSFLARWTVKTPRPLECRLHEVADRMLAGEIVNRLPIDLQECHLLYDRWAYWIPSLGRGRKQQVDETLEPRYVKTWLQSGGPYNASSARVPRILDMMMFYTAAGGASYTHLLNQYQSFCDLSSLLKMGRAILVARGPVSGSQLLRDGQPIGGPHDRLWTTYRFVIPVRLTDTEDVPDAFHDKNK